MSRRANTAPVLSPAIGERASRRLRLWTAIRRLQRFTLEDLADAADVTYMAATRYVQGLTAAGYVETDGEDRQFVKRPRQIYKLVKDIGVDPPTVTTAGDTDVRRLRREQMWRTLRILAQASARELAAEASTEAAEVSLECARTFLYQLERGDYVSRIQGARPVRWRLLPGRYTGPRPPALRRYSQLIDENLGVVVYEQEEGEL